MPLRLGALILCLSILPSSPSRAANGFTIENEVLSATWQESLHRISIVHKPSEKTFIRNLTLPGDVSQAMLKSVTDVAFGKGQAIQFVDAGSIIFQIQLFQKLPFVVVRREIQNSGKSEAVFNQISFTSMEIDWGLPAEEITTFGTAGLRTFEDNPGSYAWLAAVDPQTRNGVVTGWLTHNRGSGVIFSRKEQEKLLFDARIDYGRLAIPEGKSADLEILAIGFFLDARLGLEAWADAVAKVYQVQLPEQPTGYCTWYSRPHGGASDEKHLAELADFAADHLAPRGFSFVQIDDKWQAGISNNGPRRNFTTHDPEGPYPSGMQAAAESVASFGLTPGIWFMPFAGTHYDPFFSDKQSWFVTRKDGTPYSTRWGGTCLDMTHPEARAYLRSLVEKIAHQWGFQYFKIDGLWTGTGTPLRYVNSGYEDDGIGDAIFHNPEKTNIEAFRDGLKIIREAAGPEVFILGCNAPQNMRSYGGAMGLVDAMRIGPDNGLSWKQLMRGPTFGSRHYFLHGRVWYNDPDPVYVRESLKLRHARLICSWVAISGQLYVNSDWLPDLPEERLEILKKTIPPHGMIARPVDLFQHDPPRFWSVSDASSRPKREIIGIFNWEEESQKLVCGFFELGLEENIDYVGYDFWQDKLLPSLKEELAVTLPGQSCAVLSLRPRANHPQLISTSSHVTQGIIDVIEEKWLPTKRTLSGKSLIPVGEEYELRIVLPDSQWTVSSFQATTSHGTSVTSSYEQQGKLIRAVFSSTEDAEISWRMQFD